MAGNINPDTAKKLAQKYFGKIKPSTITKNKSYGSDYKKNANFVMSIPHISTPRFVKTYTAPKKSYALDVFAKYLADGKTSYLYKKMVDDDKSALAVSASYNSLAKYGSSFGVSITPVKKNRHRYPA